MSPPLLRVFLHPPTYIRAILFISPCFPATNTLFLLPLLRVFLKWLFHVLFSADRSEPVDHLRLLRNIQSLRELLE